jgi:hypothetical protein
MDFNTLSSKKKILLRYHNELYTKTLFKLDEQGKIKKCYWSCIHKECPGKVNYEVYVDAAINDGISSIGHTILALHDNEVCKTDETEEIKPGNARYAVFGYLTMKISGNKKIGTNCSRYSGGGFNMAKKSFPTVPNEKYTGFQYVRILQGSLQSQNHLRRWHFQNMS